MEFWGVEVKSGQPLKVTPELGKLIHISQASLGEVKDLKGAKYVPLRLKVDSNKYIIGSLSAEERPQLMFDLVFEREFELSHDWKNGSIYFVGYIADDPASDDEEFSDEFDDEYEEELVDIPENGEIKAKPGAVKPAKAVGKKEVKPPSDSDDEESDSDDEMPLPGEDDSSDDVSGEDEDGDDDSSEEELPKKVQQSKKRPSETAKKTPTPAKKAKQATPDNSGNKKGHVATPFPSKGKSNKGKEQSPKKSSGQASCKSCNKSFTSDTALQSHNKAKHAGK